MARNNNSALIAELVGALQTNLAPYAPARLNTAPPTLKPAVTVDSLLGTNLNRSRQSILDELLANINAAYTASMNEQTDNERAYIQALANVSDNALDTMRNQYAGDTAVGANRGMQAANALSAILGMQGTSIEGVNELFGNRSELINQKATDTAQASTEATDLYTALQQYLADYSKSLYETDSTNHTTELASWNAYIDALMSAIPQLEYYNNSSNGGGGGYYGGDMGYTYPSTASDAVLQLIGGGANSSAPQFSSPEDVVNAYANAVRNIFPSDVPKSATPENTPAWMYALRNAANAAYPTAPDYHVPAPFIQSGVKFVPTFEDDEETWDYTKNPSVSSQTLANSVALAESIKNAKDNTSPVGDVVKHTSNPKPRVNTAQKVAGTAARAGVLPAIKSLANVTQNKLGSTAYRGGAAVKPSSTPTTNSSSASNHVGGVKKTTNNPTKPVGATASNVGGIAKTSSNTNKPNKAVNSVNTTPAYTGGASTLYNNLGINTMPANTTNNANASRTVGGTKKSNNSNKQLKTSTVTNALNNVLNSVSNAIGASSKGKTNTNAVKRTAR